MELSSLLARLERHIVDAGDNAGQHRIWYNLRREDYHTCDTGVSRMNDYSTTERVAIVVAALHHARRPIPTSTLARRIGISTGGAWAMLSRLTTVLPLTLDTDGWFLIEK